MSGSDYNRVERAIGFLESHADEQPSLAEVSRYVGLSPFHFQRLFHRWAGVTPKDFLQCLTLQRARTLLAQSHNLLETSLQLGLSGTSRLHDLFLNLEAMTPGDYKRLGNGLEIRWAVQATPFGDALFAATDRGLCALSFLCGDRSSEVVASLEQRWPNARLVHDPERTASAAAEVRSRMLGKVSAPLSLLLKGSPFQIKVWQALLAIPEGSVTSYGAVASLIGAPGASRAVGSALSQNPIAYLIPCHRVLRRSGVVGEYRWGTVRKQALLGVEAARLADRAEPPLHA